MKENLKAMRDAVLGILEMTGSDIVAPMEVRQPKLLALGLSSNVAYKRVRGQIKQMPKEVKLSFLKGLLLECLTPSQLIEINEWSSDCCTSTIEYALQHPEVREEIDPMNVLRTIMGSDFDIDKV